ncbi:MAG: branched-chain amino acid ABC transporter substrate-binding protein, partial [Desulfatibacillum sp.]|nr:branched-chain amino acid ABC transporter substrate-binding protein [Desulfatibacillum sp.]
MRKKCKVLLVFFIIGAVGLGLAGPGLAKTVKVGGIMDTTGATSDVGKDYAFGMVEAFKYI